MVFSSLVDAAWLGTDLANIGQKGEGFQGGTQQITFPATTQEGENYPADASHSALITIYEACWFNSWSASFAKDAGVIMESGDVTISDVHDFASVYGEFLATGNDPTLGQLGSIRFGESDSGFTVAGVGGGAGLAESAEAIGFTATV